MSSRKDLALGIFIVVAGVVILLGKLGVFGFWEERYGRSSSAGYFCISCFGRRATAAVLIRAVF